jgi:hypothetical protein
MTLRRSIASVAGTARCWCLVAVLLPLSGCASDTFPSSPSNRAAQQAGAQKAVDQSAKSKFGRRSGSPIVTKSIKALIIKDALQ